MSSLYWAIQQYFSSQCVVHTTVPNFLGVHVVYIALITYSTSLDTHTVGTMSSLVHIYVLIFRGLGFIFTYSYPPEAQAWC